MDASDIPSSKVSPPGRRRLLRAGLKMFTEKGYSGASLRGIADEADVSLGLIRIHFGSKNDLRRAVDAYVLERVRKLYLTVLSHSADAALEQVTSDAVTWIRENTDALMYTRTALLEKTEGGEALFKELLQTMREFVEENEKLGYLADDVDKDWAALYMVFDLIGPAVIEPFAKSVLGESVYSDSMISSRNAFMRTLFTAGIYRSS